MNIRFLLTAAVAAISIAAFAQGKPPVGGPGQGRGGFGQGNRQRGGMPDELKKQLALTPLQESKIKAIQDKYRAKMMEAFKGMQRPQPGTQPDPKQMEAMRAKMKPIMEARQKEIDAVLTPKQREIMKKWRAAHPPRFGMGGGRPGGPGVKGGGH